MDLTDFLQQLRETYGTFSIERLRKKYGDTSPEVILGSGRNDTFAPAKPPEFTNTTQPFPKNFPLTDIVQRFPGTSEPITKPEKIFESPVTNPYEPVNTPPRRFPPIINYPSVPRPTPQPKIISPFSPVNIATTRDWIKLREEVLDVHELTNFFAGKMDSQSPMFKGILEKYQNAVNKALATPHEIDEESSANFVDKLANVIKDRFFSILKSYQRGIQGKAAQPKEYYLELENRVKQYFNRIGLKSDNVKRLDNSRDSQERMNLTPTPTLNKFLDGMIAEVIVQPHYFEYHDDDGEVRKRWIDGECIVYKY